MWAEPLKYILPGALTVALILLVTRQCRRPYWRLGRRVARVMNIQHSALTDWGLEHVSIEKSFTLLDVGCGGGRTVQKLAAIASEGKIAGIDYSAASVAVARLTNAHAIESGRVEILEGTVSRLPFSDGTFDGVTAVETHYYWPNLDADVREVLRVLKPGGTLLLVAEAYKGRRLDFVYRPVMMLLRATYLTVDEHRDALRAAGYADVEVFVERDRGWICAVGRKPVGA